MSDVCLACGKNIVAGKSKCSICGFPVMGVTQDNSELLVEMKKMANEYIGSKVGDYAVGIQSYQYVFKNGKIQLERINELEIAGYNELISEKIVWSDKVYRGIDSDKPVRLQIYVQKKGGNKQKCTVEIMPPIGMKDTYIGVKRDGISAQIVWGTEENYTTSKTFALIS